MSRFIVLPARVLADDRLSSMSHLKVLCGLGQHTDKRGWGSPSLKRLGALAGKEGAPLSKSRVSHILNDLEAWGYIERHKRSRDSDGGQTSNLYRVLFDIGEPDAGPFADETVASDATPPLRDTQPPVASHGAQPPVASHGAQPHKNAPDEGKENLSCGSGPEATAEPVGPAQSVPSVSQRIVEQFHANCPTLKTIKLLTDSRRQAIRNRWMQAGRDLGRYDPKDVEAGLAWWARFFQVVNASDFLSGRNAKWGKCGFDWLMQQKNFVKVVEGNYDNEEAQ